MAVQVVLEHLEAHLVPVFEGSIVLRVLLDRIISQMHILIIRVVRVDVELRGGGAQVPFREKVQRGIIIEEYPDAYVKLSLIDKERFLYVFLQDKAIVLDFILLLLGDLLLRLSLKL